MRLIWTCLRGPRLAHKEKQFQHVSASLYEDSWETIQVLDQGCIYSVRSSLVAVKSMNVLEEPMSKRIRLADEEGYTFVVTHDLEEDDPEQRPHRRCPPVRGDPPRRHR